MKGELELTLWDRHEGRPLVCRQRLPNTLHQSAIIPETRSGAGEA
jgi:hypothetical protein